MWVGHARGPVILGAAAVTLAFAVRQLIVGTWITLPFLAFAFVLLMSFSRITTMVDRRGLAVLFSRWSRPRTIVALDDIVAVEVVHRSPIQWGGWGYR